MKTNDVFTRMQSATQKAFDRVGKTAGIPTDPDLRIYQSLQPKDFDAMVQHYGADNVMNYVKQMEGRRLGALNSGGQNANG